MTLQEQAVIDITNRIQKYKNYRDGLDISQRRNKMKLTQKIKVLEFELRCVMGDKNK